MTGDGQALYGMRNMSPKLPDGIGKKPLVPKFFDAVSKRQDAVSCMRERTPLVSGAGGDWPFLTTTIAVRRAVPVHQN